MEKVLNLQEVQYKLFVDWLKICCNNNHVSKVLSSDIYDHFTLWCEIREKGNAWSRKKLSLMLKKQGFTLYKGTGGRRMIEGLSLLSKEEIMKNNETAFPGYEMQDNYGVISPEDSHLWLELFILASKKKRELCEVLQYVRNTGAKLVRNPKYGYIIQPVIGVYGWSSKEEYMRERKPLEKHRELLLKLLADLTKGASGR